MQFKLNLLLKLPLLKTKLKCLKNVISLWLSSADISKACGLVSTTSKKYLHLSYRTRISQVHSQTTNSGMASEVILMHKQNSVCWLLLLHMLQCYLLSLICHESKSTFQEIHANWTTKYFLLHLVINQRLLAAETSEQFLCCCFLLIS